MPLNSISRTILGKYKNHKDIKENSIFPFTTQPFVGNLYLETKDKGLVATLSGHDPNSDAFNRYWAPNEELRLEMIEKLERVTEKKQEKVEQPTAKPSIKPVHPGIILKRLLDAHDYNTKDLALLIGSTQDTLDNIIAEKSNITADVAQGLEMVFGVSAAM